MNIFYLNGPYPFCYYYRGYLPGVYSEQMVVTDFLRGKSVDTPEIAGKIALADVVVMQRPINKEHVDVARKVKGIGKKLLAENDDSYYPDRGIPLARLQNDKQREIAKEIHANFLEVAHMADGMIASTDTLGREFREITPNVAVLKNCIDPLDEMENGKNTTGKFRVGFTASVTTNDDYKHIKDDIRRLDARDDITIVVQGIKHQDDTILDFMREDYEFWNSLKNVEWHPYVHVTDYMSNLASLALDVALIPRKDSYFNRCKSNLKYLEMSLLKIPILAQGFPTGDSPYQKGCAHLTVVDSGDSWYDKVIEVKEKHSDYLSLAQKAHDFVLETYNIESFASTWTQTVERLCNTPQTYSQKRTTQVPA